MVEGHDSPFKGSLDEPKKGTSNAELSGGRCVNILMAFFSGGRCLVFGKEKCSREPKCIFFNKTTSDFDFKKTASATKKHSLKLTALKPLKINGWLEDEISQIGMVWVQTAI